MLSVVALREHRRNITRFGFCSLWQLYVDITGVFLLLLRFFGWCLRFFFRFYLFEGERTQAGNVGRGRSRLTEQEA